MSKLSAVSSSDWHFYGGLDRFFGERTVERQIAEIRKPFDHCVQHGLGHLFCPGDISDRARLPEDELIALITLLTTYKKIQFHYVMGNHDFARVGRTAMDVIKSMVDNGLMKHVHLYYKPEIVEIDGIQVAFVPYPFNAAPKSKSPLLIFAHGEEPGAMGDYGQPLKVKEDSQHRVHRRPEDFVISGHIHQYQYLKKQRWIFNGSPYQKTFGEKKPKGFIEFTAKYNKGELDVDHTFVNSNPSFTLKDVHIETEADWATLEKSDSVFYRVILGQGVVVPRNLTKDLPNVISFKGTHETVNAKGEEIAVADNMPKITALTGLNGFLEKLGATSKDIKTARGWVKEAMQQLGTQQQD